MRDVADLIRERAGRGEISHLSLIANGKQWTASYAASHVFGVTRCSHADPVEALVGALSAPAKSRTRVSTEKPNAKQVDDFTDEDEFG